MSKQSEQSEQSEHSEPSGQSEGEGPQRVVSLLGASTEILYRLGLGNRLVGRSHECDYPPVCLDLPSVSSPRLDPQGSSSEIDTQVRLHASSGESVYTLEDKLIKQLDPDLLIVQDHCNVCAITPNDVPSSSQTCSNLNISQLVVKPTTLQEVLDDVTLIAKAMKVPRRGEALRNTLQMRIDRVKQVVHDSCTPKFQSKPRVALLEWCDPIMGCGYWLPELVNVAGGQALHSPSVPGGHTPTISFEKLLESKPDSVVFALCGFGVARTAKELKTSWGKEKLEQLKECCNGNVFVADGNYLINRSGPRVVESCEALAEAIHPILNGHFGMIGTDLLRTLDQAMRMEECIVGNKAAIISARTQDNPSNGQVSSTDTASIASKPSNPNSNSNSNSKEALEVVRSQLEFMRKGDMEAAFALNSHANQKRWCDAGRFSHVLKTHDNFRRLLTEVPTLTLEPVAAQTDGDHAVAINVVLPANGDKHQLELQWAMVPENHGSSDKPGWRTEKVNIV